MADKPYNALDYAKMGADTLIRKFKVDELPPKDRFHYHQGVFLSGMERVYQLSGEDKYYQYIKDWVDYYVDADGAIRFDTHDRQFDDMQPAILLFNLYKKTGDERYKKALDSFAPIVDMWPTNAYGGYWHKYDRPNQMWLDGLYMIGPFSAMYAHYFNKPYFFEKIYNQMNLMRRNMTDPHIGLLYHAWDDSKQMSWADSASGLSPEFWGRAIGWYAVAIFDILDYIPPEHRRRQEFIDAGLDIVHSLIRYQDAETGLWYQVVDKGDRKDNWQETSCSSLYTYAIAKAIKKGLLDTSYAQYMHKAFRGITGGLAFEGDGLVISNICIGTGVGDYDFYIKRPTVQNDLHGMGAFLLMCTEYYSACSKDGHTPSI
ncbi:MAG: glycoside hydrolase family 88 protein [Treponema sp.]|nr:glycoside hydrolase family 88 protein [Treponema sp.]